MTDSEIIWHMEGAVLNSSDEELQQIIQSSSNGRSSSANQLLDIAQQEFARRKSAAALDRRLTIPLTLNELSHLDRPSRLTDNERAELARQRLDEFQLRKSLPPRATRDGVVMPLLVGGIGLIGTMVVYLTRSQEPFAGILYYYLIAASNAAVVALGLIRVKNGKREDDDDYMFAVICGAVVGALFMAILVMIEMIQYTPT